MPVTNETVFNTTEPTTAEAAAIADTTAKAKAKAKRPNKAARTEQSKRQQKQNALCRAALVLIASRISKTRDCIRLIGTILAQAATSEAAVKTGGNMLSRFRTAAKGFASPGMPDAEESVRLWSELAATDVTVRLAKPVTLSDGSSIESVRTGDWLQQIVADCLNPSTSKARLTRLIEQANAVKEEDFTA
jgi:hypothetical protein